MKKITFGFVGTGVLASSVITGICSSPEIKNTGVVVSPRNAETARRLAAVYDNVKIAASNQEVLDASDWVMISVLPPAAEEVTRKLSFRPDHTVISVVASKRLDVIQNWTSPAARLIRMVPMPFAARRTGPIAMYPSDGEIEEFFGRLGRVVVMDDETQVETANAITSVTNALYTVINDVAGWGERSGLPRGRALGYTISYFSAMLEQIAGDRAAELERLVKERTPGGINDLVLRLFYEQNAFRAWTEGLDAALKRVRADYI
ncbi:MAG: NAD(P)-binding domain-containing protein [Synergistaceae bacterium]|jgi:pyrroline-5-carboxylate reductase|nr:NAD(P)-binding domain-containing protein [Synergistaceae bacterium]